MVWRRVQNYGLQSSLSQTKNNNLRSDLHSLIALAFVPVADVKDNFDDLVETIDPSLAIVVAHIHKYYIHGRCVGKKLIDPVFPPAIWNCHERVLNDLPRTTNLLEGFHNKLNRFCETSHLNLFSFVSKIQDIEQDALLDRLLALTGQLTRAKNLKQVKLEIRIYLAILAKLLKLQRFDSINYLPSVRE